MSVAVNPPKTPVTKGSNGIAMATLPNICKMPGPPAPFVPAPLPNIGKSGDKPKGYTKKVKVEKKTVAIKGASFGSMGDMASKGTGGGLISANTHGPCKFIGPGSMDVKFEGKNVQLLTDPMTNNGGGSGSPPNAATMLGILQMTGIVTVVPKAPCPLCGEDHDSLEETDETKNVEMASLVKNFEKECEPAFEAGKNVSTMLGVVVCKYCNKKYADQSSGVSEELCKAADSAGMEHSPSQFQYATANSRTRQEKGDEAGNAVLEAMKTRFGHSTAFEDALTEADASAEDSWNNRKKVPPPPAAYPPGFCAAQGALMHLLTDGCLPGGMTEEWFSRNPTPPIRCLDQTGGFAVLVSRSFNPGETVPPCETCELLLDFLICDEDKPTCSH